MKVIRVNKDDAIWFALIAVVLLSVVIIGGVILAMNGFFN